MGLWNKIKDFLNIGGVSVKLVDYTNPLSRTRPVVTGSVRLTSKSDKRIKSIDVKVIEEYTSGRGEEKTTETTELGSFHVPGLKPGLGYPLDIKAGETRDEPFEFEVALTKRLQDNAGVLGAIGKLGALASAEKVEYYLMAEADVESTPLDPTDRVELKVGD